MLLQGKFDILKLLLQ